MSSLRRNGRAGRAGAPAGGALLLALLALLCWPVANAEPLAGTPEVRSAFVARVGGVYQLNAEIGYPPTTRRQRRCATASPSPTTSR